VDIVIEEDTSENPFFYRFRQRQGMDEKQLLTVQNPFFTTLAVLVTGWPDRDFSFHHANDKGHFPVSTEELVAILENRNLLAIPEMAQWLHRYVTENIKKRSVQGGNECLAEDYQS
jgi:hypothetical protein